MEILVIIVAFWLILVGAYGGMMLLNGREKRGAGYRASPPPPRVRVAKFEQAPLPSAKS